MVHKLFGFDQKSAPIRLTILVVLAIFVTSYSAALADQWFPAEVKTYYSQDHRVRFTVTPRGVRSPLAYFEGKVNDENQAGQEPSGSPFAKGVLEQQDRSGRWGTIWDEKLVNDVSPVSVLVSNSARYVVTFDNWHFMGGGDSAVVIYGEGGKLIRSFALTDLLPDYYVKALPRSVSSIWWSGKHRLAEKDGLLILSVVVPNDDGDTDERSYVELPVRLESGEVLPVSGADWDKARPAARRVAAARQKAEDAWNEEFRNPLLAPKSPDDNWMHYLHEVYMRTDPTATDEKGFDTVQIILPPRGDHSFADMVKRLRDDLLDWPEPHVMMLVSPTSPDELYEVLVPILREVKPGAFKGWKIYVVCQVSYRERFATLFAPTGATFIHVDPTVRTPQRPERLKEMGLEP